MELGFSDQTFFSTGEEIPLEELFESVNFCDLVHEEAINVKDCTSLEQLLNTEKDVDQYSRIHTGFFCQKM